LEREGHGKGKKKKKGERIGKVTIEKRMREIIEVEEDYTVEMQRDWVVKMKVKG
jgi:hypothetical protein